VLGEPPGGGGRGASSGQAGVHGAELALFEGAVLVVPGAAGLTHTAEVSGISKHLLQAAGQGGGGIGLDHAPGHAVDDVLGEGSGNCRQRR